MVLNWLDAWYDAAVRSPKRKRLAQEIVKGYRLNPDQVYSWRSNRRSTVRLFTNSTSERTALIHLKARVAAQLGKPSEDTRQVSAKIGDDGSLRVVITDN